MLDCDQYLMPKSLDEAFDCIEQYSGGHLIVSGTTDIFPWAREGRGGNVHVPAVIDLSRVAEMKGVEQKGGRIWMGANTTFAEFLDNPLLREQTPVLANCAVWFADDQLREMATLAGNIVNASPAADGTPPMMAMNGQITLESRRGGQRKTRKMALEEFITGPGATRLEEGEILSAIECDALGGYGAAFKKVGPRRSLVLSTVCLAVLVRVDEAQSRFEDVRLALGAVGPVPVRLSECEAFLKGKPVTPETIAEAARMPVRHVKSRTRQEYRREVVAHFVEEGLTDALADLGISLGGISPGGGSPGHSSQ